MQLKMAVSYFYWHIANWTQEENYQVNENTEKIQGCIL